MTQAKQTGEGRLIRANFQQNYLLAYRQLQTMSLCTPSITPLVIMQIGPCERNTPLSTFPLAHLPQSGNECIRGEFSQREKLQLSNYESGTYHTLRKGRKFEISMRHVFILLKLQRKLNKRQNSTVSINYKFLGRLKTILFFKILNQIYIFYS